MKRLVLTLAVALVTALSASAQRLANIQVEARFITDKMVLELGLSNVQRNNIMQLNLSYLDAINSYRDINGKAWKHRNKELRRMMSDRQWKRYKESYYFYQPIDWRSNAYVHNIYAKYPNRVVVVHESKPCKHHKHYKSCKPSSIISMTSMTNTISTTNIISTTSIVNTIRTTGMRSIRSEAVVSGISDNQVLLRCSTSVI